MKKRVFLSKIRFRYIKRAIVDFKDVFKQVSKSEPIVSGNRILIFNWRDTKHSFSGGAEVYIHELAKRWVADGNIVTVFSGSDGKSKRNETIDGVHVIRRGGFYFVYLWAFVYYIIRLRHKTDIIVDCENGIPFFTPLYARKPKFLVIHHVHQEIFRKSLPSVLAELASFMEGKLMPFVYRNVQIITVSPSSKDEILFHKLTKKEPQIIYNGIDLNLYTTGRKSRTPLVVYVGRLQAYKSINHFLQTANILLRTVPNAQFVIAGDGEERRSLVKQTKALNLENHVSFLGKISEEEKISLYKKAWVFMNPSVREGWGITTIEANACGTPVVASNVSGLKDSIQTDRTGYLVEYGDVHGFAQKLSLLLTDEKLRRKFSRQATNWASQFNWDASAGSFYATMTEKSTETTAARQKNISYYLNKLHTLIF